MMRILLIAISLIFLGALLFAPLGVVFVSAFGNGIASRLLQVTR